MPALIYDTSASAFKEAEPKVYNGNAFADSEGKMYNGSEWVDCLDKYIPGTSITIGNDYKLGSGAKATGNGTIRVRCLSKSGSNAVMQTNAVTSNNNPPLGDLTSQYAQFFGSLASAISGVKLPTGSTINNVNPGGAYDMMQTGLYGGGAQAGFSWLGTRCPNVDPVNGREMYYAMRKGEVTEYTVGGWAKLTCAPYFTLNLTKVRINVNKNEIQAI